MPNANFSAFIFWSNKKETFALFVLINKKSAYGTAIGFRKQFNSANLFGKVSICNYFIVKEKKLISSTETGLL